jgi:hypothetical protein
MNTGRVKICGPLTKEDRVIRDHMVGLLDESDRVIGQLSEDLKRSRSKRRRQAIADEIAELQQARAKLVDVIGEPRRRCGG